MVIIITPKRLGRITSLVASYTTSSLSLMGSTEPVRLCASLKRLMQFSTMMTAPSTINPKSSAPKLIKFALTPVCTIPVIVASIASGITAAVIIAALIFPSRRNNTTITSNAPSTRFLRTVLIALSTSAVLS